MSIHGVPHRALRVLLPVLATLAVATACAGSPSRAYAVPKSLCGLRLPQGSYEELFGAGEELAEEPSDQPWGSGKGVSQGCQYYVDGDVRVHVFGHWARKGDTSAPSTPDEVIEENPGVKPKAYAGRYDVSTWRNGAVAAVDCRRPGADARDDVYLLDIHATATPLNEDRKRAHRVFGKLAQAAMGEVERKLPCGGK